MVRSLLKISLLVATVLLISITTPLTAGAQTQRSIFTYAAKFVCGKGNEKLVSPGQYFTNINVHNPSPFNKTVYIKRFAIALPEERTGKLSKFFGAVLDPDLAMTIDCDKHLQTYRDAARIFPGRLCADLQFNGAGRSVGIHRRPQ
jgi:hypothetical protein